jgi:hypothetical protein
LVDPFTRDRPVARVGDHDLDFAFRGATSAATTLRSAVCGAGWFIGIFCTLSSAP